MLETKQWNVQVKNEQYDEAIKEAATLIKVGDTVAFPTETVYGLGADATNYDAVAKIFKAKGRPQDNPLIAHVATKEQLGRLVEHIPEYVEKLINHFSPGPITYILPTNGTCAENVTAGLSTIGIRIPDHPVARDLLLACDLPVAAPSANVSGKPSPTLAAHVWEDLQGKIAGILDGGQSGIGLESTVLDCTQPIPVILRPGGVTKEQIEEVIGPVMMDPALLNEKEKPKSPGMKYRHYAPEVPLWVIQGSVNKIQGIYDEERKKGKNIAVLATTDTLKKLEVDKATSLGDTIFDVATNLYDGLRKYKKDDVDLIICEGFSEVGMGQTVMNRLQKAASKYIVD